MAPADATNLMLGFGLIKSKISVAAGFGGRGKYTGTVVVACVVYKIVAVAACQSVCRPAAAGTTLGSGTAYHGVAGEE